METTSTHDLYCETNIYGAPIPYGADFSLHFFLASISDSSKKKTVVRMQTNDMTRKRAEAFQFDGKQVDVVTHESYANVEE